MDLGKIPPHDIEAEQAILQSNLFRNSKFIFKK